MMSFFSKILKGFRINPKRSFLITCGCLCVLYFSALGTAIEAILAMCKLPRLGILSYTIPGIILTWAMSLKIGGSE